MPYKRVGSVIYHKKSGKWKVKQRCDSVAKAKRALRLLYGIESGEWKPTGKAARDVRRRRRNRYTSALA